MHSIGGIQHIRFKTIDGSYEEWPAFLITFKHDRDGKYYAVIKDKKKSFEISESVFAKALTSWRR